MKYLILFIAFSCHGICFCQEISILNEIPKNGVRFYIGFQKVNEKFNYIQAAQKYNCEKAGSLLQKVELHRAIIPVNNGGRRFGEPASTSFYLKIYDVDSLTGGPGKSLINDAFMVRNGTNSIVKIDLKKQKIVIPGKAFFVGIEWIFDKHNQRLMNIKPDQFIKDKRFEVADLIYQPFLGMVKNNKAYSDAWVMTPEHTWKLYTHNLPYMTDLSITAYIESK